MYVLIESEGGKSLVKMTKAQATQIKKLLEREFEWPDEVNEILDKCEAIPVPFLNTCGDGWGWYDPE